MSLTEKNQKWVKNSNIDKQIVTNGIEKKVLAHCDELMCVENYFEKGAVGAMHNHPHTQITYVAEGIFEFTIDNEKRTVCKGDTLLKRDGVEHGCICLEKGLLIDFFTPMRKDFV